jgi:F-type H+-transporting ATPase subunit b
VINAVGAAVGPVVGRLVAADNELPESDLNPIALEFKEMLWGFGSFAVFALVLRYALWPPLKRSIDERSQRVADNLAAAEAVTEAARGDVEAYESARAEVRAEAHAIIEAARATLESERADKVAVANAETAEVRARALAEVDAAREASRSDVEAAVVAVATSVTERALGRRPSDDAVRNALSQTSPTGAAR